eukprot:gene7335-7547_t
MQATTKADNPAAPVKDLTRQELQSALVYGTIASCAYTDKEEEVRKRFDAFKTGELRGVPFKLFKATGTLWSTPLGTIKAKTDTEVLCVRMPDDEKGRTEMVVAFRGTETDRGAGVMADVFTDLFALQSHISKMKGVPKDRYDQSVEVHRGFLTSFNDVVQQTNDGGYDSMTAVRDELFGKGVLPDRVVVCGHSLGAALGTLGAFWLKTIMPTVEVECYAFASPRVGNKGFVAAFKASISKCLRFTHKEDVVPAVPASSAWSHVASPVMLLEPAADTYGISLAPSTSASKYRAVKADRPRLGVYASVSDHSMDLYLQAIEDVLTSMDTIVDKQ